VHTKLAAKPGQQAAKQLIMRKIRTLQDEVEAAAEKRVPAYQVMPGIVVTHSLPAMR